MDMETKLYKTRKVMRGGIIFEQIAHYKRTVNHGNNIGKNLSTKYTDIPLDNPDCDPKCKGAVPGGIWLCTSGECIFYPNPS